MNKTITKKQADRLGVIREESLIIQSRFDALHDEAINITKEDDYAGYTFDFVYNDFGSVEDLLLILKMSVE